MNEPVLAMIDKLHARLDDLADVVRQVPYELNGYDAKLDKIDDQVYLMEVELEKKLEGSVPLKPVSDAESAAFDAAAGKTDAESSAKSSEGKKTESADSQTAKDDGEDKEEGFLSESAKETLSSATKTLNSIYKDGKEVVGEFSEAFDDIKDVFGVKNFFKKR